VGERMFFYISKKNSFSRWQQKEGTAEGTS